MRFITIFHNFLTTFSGFIVLLLLVISLGAIYGVVSLQKMSLDARGFVNTTMLSLLIDWDDSHFLDYTSQDLQEQITDEQLHEMNTVFNHLGELLNYHGAHGGLFRSTSSWWHISARYKVQASFQGGQFIAIITLVKQQGHWTIGRFDYQYAFFPIERRSSSIKRV